VNGHPFPPLLSAHHSKRQPLPLLPPPSAVSQPYRAAPGLAAPRPHVSTTWIASPRTAPYHIDAHADPAFCPSRRRRHRGSPAEFLAPRSRGTVLPQADRLGCQPRPPLLNSPTVPSSSCRPRSRAGRAAVRLSVNSRGVMCSNWASGPEPPPSFSYGCLGRPVTGASTTAESAQLTGLTLPRSVPRPTGSALALHCNGDSIAACRRVDQQLPGAVVIPGPPRYTNTSSPPPAANSRDQRPGFAARSAMRNPFVV